MNAVAARFLVVAAAVVLVAGGLVAAPTRAGAAVSTADAAVVSVCRYFPLSPDPNYAGASQTVFAVTITNVGSTVSVGPVLGGINQPGRQKSALGARTRGPLQPGEVTRVKYPADQLVPGVGLTIIAVFDGSTNPSEIWENNMTIADPWAVPAC